MGETLNCSLKILHRMRVDEAIQQEGLFSEIRERLMALCCSALENYLEKEQSFCKDSSSAPFFTTESTSEKEAIALEIEREILGLTPIMSQVVLPSLKLTETERLEKNSSLLVPLLCGLTVVNSREIRVLVKEVLLMMFRIKTGCG